MNIVSDLQFVLSLGVQDPTAVLGVYVTTTGE